MTTTTARVTGDPPFTRQAVKAIARAVDTEHDFAGWLAAVLAEVAGLKGSSTRSPLAAPARGRPAWSSSSSGARSATTTST